MLAVFLLVAGVSCGRKTSNKKSDTPAVNASPGDVKKDAKDEEEKIDAGKLIKEIWDVKARFVSYESELTIDRLNPDFLRNVLPNFDDVRYLNAKSYIHYVRAPKKYQLQMYAQGRGKYYYTLTSTDGYIFKLDPGYNIIPGKNPRRERRGGIREHLQDDKV